MSAQFSDTQQPVVVLADNAWWDGYDASIRGADLAEMQTPEAIEGWWAAKAHQEDTDSYEEWMLEIQWIQGGC